MMSRGRLLNAEFMGLETWTILCSKSTTSILPGTLKRDEPVIKINLERNVMLVELSIKSLATEI